MLIFPSALQVTGSCSARCPCPGEPVLCPAGVSAVSNGCGCCKVCAAQLNQDCGPLKPCDHHKGLECNYGNDVTMAEGVCTAKSEGRTCEYNGRMYQNGESFRVGCKHQCTCLDGAVGCAPLCINKLPPPSPTCPLPSLIKTPGKCCPFVHCHKRTWHLSWKKKVGNVTAPDKNSNHVTCQYKQGLAAILRMKENTCPVQTTSWSQCSRSCGTGISSRISNKNTECKLQKETRICTIRPCHSLLKVQKCSPTQKAPGALRLSYGECVSLRLYRPNYCSVCADGRCCSPQKTRTIPVSFVCPSGQSFHKSAMFVQSCKCSTDCGHLNEVALPPQHWMYGDTHKFID
uniref:Uncharacterized protein n=1 Tax=Periophthalmus magnuspinnatus TaxID=409849 RepID=A0A3B4BET7_9GOBI